MTYGKLLVAHHHRQSQLCTYQSYKIIVSQLFHVNLLSASSDIAAT